MNRYLKPLVIFILALNLIVSSRWLQFDHSGLLQHHNDLEYPNQHTLLAGVISFSYSHILMFEYKGRRVELFWMDEGPSVSNLLRHYRKCLRAQNINIGQANNNFFLCLCWNKPMKCHHTVCLSSQYQSLYVLFIFVELISLTLGCQAAFYNWNQLLKHLHTKDNINLLRNQLNQDNLQKLNTENHNLGFKSSNQL